MKRTIKFILSGGIMLILIIDSETVKLAAKDSLELCMRAVIPSLFPFMLASAFFSNNLYDVKISLLRPLYSLCRIREDHGGYVLLGLFGGYPVGAKCINDAYKKGNLSITEGHRLLGFCSNAGPSFIFGIIGCMFPSQKAVWTLWGIHIISALIVGIILPSSEKDMSVNSSVSVYRSDILTGSIKTMSVICTWVIIFKILLSFCEKWFLSQLPLVANVTFSGFLELTNGCIQLSSISSPGLRFILASVFLSFGGVCVTMQTTSVTHDIGTGFYYIGKVLQTLISFLLAYCVQFLTLGIQERTFIPFQYIAFCLITLFFSVIYLYRKKVVAFLGKLVYTVPEN